VKVVKFGAATINTDGSITVTVQVSPDNAIEAAFLGFVAATVQNVGGSNPDPMAAILAEAQALNIAIPS